jgi:glutaredoxin
MGNARAQAITLTGLNVLRQGEGVSSQKKIVFTDRNITADESALAELENLGYMTTPVTVIDGQVVVGFDRDKLQRLLETP